MGSSALSGFDRRVLERLGELRKPRVTEDKLRRALGAGGEQLEASLRRLADAGLVVRGPKRRVALADRVGLVIGIVRAGRRGAALVIPEPNGRPYRLPQAAGRELLDGDRVAIEPDRMRGEGLPSARLVRVLERRRTHVVGRVVDGRPRRLLPSDRALAGHVVLLEDGGAEAPPGATVAARITRYPSSWSGITACVEEVLGQTGSLPTEIRTICYGLGIPEAFPPEVEAAADALGEPGPETLRGRTDLRDEVVFTIDPSDAKDHDDAASIRATSRGWELTVSIADVSWYVRPGSPLDAEAFERGTSVYFPGRAVPMLPHRISGDLASLGPGVDRLAVSAVLDVDRKGDVTGARFVRSVLRSRARLSYEQAQACLDGQADAAVTEEVAASLRTMAECARALLGRRMARGAIDMDIPEAVVEVDADGEVRTIGKRRRLFAHRLIEEFALATNEAVARFLEERGTALIYRIHENPDPDNVLRLGSRLAALDLRLERDGYEPPPAAFQAVIEKAEATALARQVNLLVLRSLSLARYSAEKEIHFGLASKAYTHFTSPIRRYPDLLVHRQLLVAIGAEPGPAATREALRVAAAQSSTRERRAADAERDAVAAAGVLLMADRIGEVFDGSVAGVERWGYFVEFDEVFVEGVVPVSRLREYFEFIPERLELASRSSNASIRIGARVRVRLIAVDLAARRLELEPA